MLRRAQVAAIERELISRDQVLKEVCEGILQAQARMKKAYDSHHQEREFYVRDWVFLKLMPYKQMSLVERKISSFLLDIMVLLKSLIRLEKLLAHWTHLLPLDCIWYFMFPYLRSKLERFTQF